MNISSINPVQAAAEPAAPRPIHQDQRELVHAIKAVNGAELFGQDNELSFIMDRPTRRMVVRIVNRTTGDVVDQIPEQYVLNLAAQLVEKGK